MIRIGLPSKNVLPKPNLGPADFALILGMFALLYGLAKVGAGFFASFHPPQDMPQITLDPRMLPYYAARSTIRMFAGLGLSILFTLSYGWAAAKNKRAERILIPLLDILQSVPVLGFLSVTVTGFMALFPGSLFGLECASIFAIFTGQAWNMAFSFYHSLITLPAELAEAATVFRLSPWRRFVKLEVPSAMIGLVWNGMMSFGGGWFFVSASEAISVLNQSYTLPGIGSYVAAAIKARDLHALAWAILTVALLIFIIDQLFWRPMVAWAEKFRLERSGGGIVPTSWVLDLIRTAHLPRRISRSWRRLRRKLPPVPALPRLPSLRAQRKGRTYFGEDTVFGGFLGVACIAGLFVASRFVLTEVPISEVQRAVGLGFLTLIRVLVLVALATAIWTPLGVAIGFNPKLARILQPVVLLLASFPANFIFPVATVFFLRSHMSLDWGSAILMFIGAQWYVLFNVIAGASGVPTDLREMASSLGLSGWAKWKKLIIPAIFPAWVTGAITASGGAWNASIVSEVVTWGDRTLKAHGLGSYIADATAKGDWPRIALGVALMCAFVVTINRLLWRRLYTLAESRYRLG